MCTNIPSYITEGDELIFTQTKLVNIKVQIPCVEEMLPKLPSSEALRPTSTGLVLTIAIDDESISSLREAARWRALSGIVVESIEVIVLRRWCWLPRRVFADSKLLCKVLWSCSFSPPFSEFFRRWNESLSKLEDSISLVLFFDESMRLFFNLIKQPWIILTAKISIPHT